MLNFIENDLGFRAPKPGGGWRWVEVGCGWSWDAGEGGVGVGWRTIQNLKLTGAP